VLFLAFDGITKVVRVKPVMEACQKMGISPAMAVGIGVLLLACTVLAVGPAAAESIARPLPLACGSVPP